MSSLTKSILLETGGHGTEQFLVGAERRPLYGYPLCMAYRCALIERKLEWAKTSEVDRAELHFILKDNSLSDEQWRLFQLLWLYAHGDDKAFAEVHIAEQTADQLRDYLQSSDHLAFRLATRHTAPTNQDELDRVHAEVCQVVTQTAALPEDELYDAVEQIDTTLHRHQGWLHDSHILRALPPLAKLVFPVTYSKRHSPDNWNFRGQLAQYLPPYVRQWLVDRHAEWEVRSTDQLALFVMHDEWCCNTHRLPPVPLQGSAHDDQLILIPKAVVSSQGHQRPVVGCAKHMLYTPTVDDTTHKLVIDRHTRGEDAWRRLLHMFEDEPVLVLAELWREIGLLGRQVEIARLEARMHELVDEASRLLAAAEARNDAEGQDHYMSAWSDAWDELQEFKREVAMEMPYDYPEDPFEDLLEGVTGVAAPGF